MMETNYISTQTICTQYEIELSFVDDLQKLGLIEITIIEHQRYIHQDQIRLLEKIITLHHDLNINLEGVDVVLNLLAKESALRKEVNALKNRLRLYESD